MGRGRWPADCDRATALDRPTLVARGSLKPSSLEADMTRTLVTLSAGIIAVVALTVGVQAQKTKTTSGVVKALSDTSITIQATTGDKGSHTFSLDAETQVTARGATQATKGRGRAAITTMIAVGDSVTVTFDPAKTDRASEVKLDRKAAKS